MIAASPPDARAAASAQIESLRADPGAIERRLARVLGDWPDIDAARLLAGLEEFHHQRMERMPSTTTYPEAGPWAQHVIEVDRLVREGAGLSHRQMAIMRSLNDYLAFRGHLAAAPGRPVSPERCRVAWIPDTDEGPLHIKNVDDPMPETWPPPRPVYRAMPCSEPLVWDGVGSGLHIDEEPPEIFPLPVRQMALAHCASVPEAVSFLTRYKPFWGRQNVVLHDQKGNAVAIEKSSFNHMETFEPDLNGRVWVSGMTARDPASPQGRHVRRMRQTYLDRFQLGPDGPDAAFWAGAERLHRMLTDFLAQPGPLGVDDVFDLFLATFPRGLNKDGTKAHPEQANVQYTLVTHGTLLDKRRTYRYERCARSKRMPKAPEVFDWN